MTRDRRFHLLEPRGRYPNRPDPTGEARGTFARPLEPPPDAGAPGLPAAHERLGADPARFARRLEPDGLLDIDRSDRPADLRVCRSCSAENHGQARGCYNCGEDLTTAAQRDHDLVAARERRAAQAAAAAAAEADRESRERQDAERRAVEEELRRSLREQEVRQRARFATAWVVALSVLTVLWVVSLLAGAASDGGRILRIFLGFVTFLLVARRLGLLRLWIGRLGGARSDRDDRHRGRDEGVRFTLWLQGGRRRRDARRRHPDEE